MTRSSQVLPSRYPWLSQILDIEIPAITESQLIPPDYSPEEKMGLPVGTLTFEHCQHYTRVQQFWGAKLRHDADAKESKDLEVRKRHRKLAQRCKLIAELLQAILDIDVAQHFDLEVTDRIIYTTQWCARRMCDDDEED